MSDSDQQQEPSKKEEQGGEGKGNGPKGAPAATGFDTKYSRYFFAGIAAVVAVYFFLLVKPFLTQVFIAFVLYILGRPLYLLVRRLFRGRSAAASLVTCAALVVIVFIPFLFFCAILAAHALDFYRYVEEELRSGRLNRYLDLAQNPAMARLREAVPSLAAFDVQGAELVGKLLGELSQLVYSHAAAVLKGLSTVIAGFVITIFITFFMFIDGDRLLEEVKRLSPLDDRHDQEIIDELIRTIRITFKGSLAVAFVQGLLGGVGLLICGVRSWALWGLVMMVASFIPVVGSAIIWVPAALYLAATKQWFWAGFLAVWGVGVIGMSDNVIRTFLFRGETKIHPVLIFFSVMGGIVSFGFLGIVLGPLILSLMIYVLRMYKRFFHTQKGPA